MIEKLNLAGWARDDAEQAMEQKLNEIIDHLNDRLPPQFATGMSRPKLWTLDGNGELMPLRDVPDVPSPRLEN